MSFFSGGKNKNRSAKDKDMPGKKSQFYVEFLGWMESPGVRGHKYTEPVVHELKRRQLRTETPPKLTIQLTHKEVKITQELEEKRKPRSIKKIKFPAIPARDITYVVQSRRSTDKALEDIVACIYLGYMPRTQRYVHVHVYRFDEPSTATTFTRLLNDIISNNMDRIHEVERELVEKGQIEDPRLASSDGMSERTQHTGTDSAAGSVSGSGYSEDGLPTLGSEDLEEDLQSLCDVQPFDSVADELKHRLTMGDGPLLLPPKDYDTISRARGNMLDINERRFQLPFVGDTGTATPGDGKPGSLKPDQRQRNASEESGIDLTSPSSDSSDVISRFPLSPRHTGYDSHTAMYPSTAMQEEFVYPPRLQERGGQPKVHADLVRQSSLSSAYSAHSSQASQHSDGGGHNGGSTFRRSHSANSFNGLLPPPPPPPKQTSVMPLTSPMYTPDPEDLLPPTDYDDEDDGCFREPGVPPFLPTSPRSASGSGSVVGGGPSSLMRSLPASVMQEMSLHSPRGGGGGGGGRGVEEQERVYSGRRSSQPAYPFQNSGHVGSPSVPVDPAFRVMRRVNSMFS